MRLETLQLTLQHQYDVDVPYRVDQFVSHDAEFCAAITGSVPNAPEMLLIHQDGDDLDITVFFDQQVLNSVTANNQPLDDNFSNFCAVLEGVSHFLYLVWNARHGKQISLLELEIQAEVDKFVFASLNMPSHQENGGDRLLDKLFRDIAFQQDLSAEQLQRYQSANALAHQYCEWLTSEFALTPGERPLNAELARFYRKNAAAKISQIREQQTELSTCH